MLYLFIEDCKQPEGYKVGLLKYHNNAMYTRQWTAIF